MRGGVSWWLGALGALGAGALACEGAATDAPASTDQTPVTQRHQAILGGEVDATLDAVVALRFFGGHNDSLCSGTLIEVDPERGVAAVLTAAHCVERIPSEVVVGLDHTEPSALRFSPIDVAIHPLFRHHDDDSPHDLAVVRVVGDTRALTVIPRLGEREPLELGAEVRVAGFGRSVDNTAAPESPHDDGSRRHSVVRSVAALSDLEISLEQADGRGICHGDSGGPVLVESAEGLRVVGVIARLAPQEHLEEPCHATSVSGRMQSSLEFIRAALAAELPGACADCQARASSEGGLCLERQRACEADSNCRSAFECLRRCSSSHCRSGCLRSVPEERRNALAALERCDCELCQEPCGVTRCEALPPSPTEREPAPTPAPSAPASSTAVVSPELSGAGCHSAPDCAPSRALLLVLLGLVGARRWRTKKDNSNVV